MRNSVADNFKEVNEQFNIFENNHYLNGFLYKEVRGCGCACE